jgi:hypothetical protein
MTTSNGVALKELRWLEASCNTCADSGQGWERTARPEGCHRCYAIFLAAKSLLEAGDFEDARASADELYLDCRRQREVKFSSWLVQNSATNPVDLSKEWHAQDLDHEVESVEAAVDRVHAEAEDKDSISLPEEADTDCHMVLYHISSSESGGGLRQAEPLVDNAFDWAQLGSQAHISTPDGVDFALEAYAQCMQKHSCQSGRITSVPTRLISLAPWETLEDDVRLIDDAPDLVPPGTAYAALSYCWGNTSKYKTDCLSMTKEKLQELTEGIPFARLSPIFRDSVIVARRLGLLYLWIDALCIAQGDAADWIKESAKMGETYSDAKVTIVPAASAAADESFLDIEHLRSWRYGVEVQAQPGFAFYPKLFVRWSQNTLYYRDFGFPVVPSAIDTRGWTLQEAILSKRLLVFEHGRVVFSCMEDTYFEDKDGRSEYSVQGRSEVQGLQSTTPEEIHNIWIKIVSNFTNRRLTRYEDKLPAIAGVASKLKARCTCQPACAYLAGLWSHSMATELAWWYASDEARGHRLQAPTWSWASVQFPAWFRDREGDEFCVSTQLLSWQMHHDHELEHETTTTAQQITANEFGRVLSGRIDLRGPFTAAAIFHERSRSRYSLVSTYPLMQYFPHEIKRTHLVWWDFPVTIPDLYNKSIARSGESEDTDFFFLLQLGHYRLEKYLEVNHLVLQRVDGEADDVYRRVGFSYDILFYDDYDRGNLPQLQEQQDLHSWKRKQVLKDFDDTRATWPIGTFSII